MSVIDKLDRVEYLLKHLPGRHSQPSHGRRSGSKLVAGAHLGESKQAWRDDPWAEYTEEVPIDFVKNLAEYQWSKYDSRLTASGWEDMRASIAEEGIREPLLIELNPKEGYALLTEGNHRLAMADELGFKTVPVRVMRSKYLNPQSHPRAKKVGNVKIKPDRYGYIPGHMKPSEVFGDL